MLHCHAVRSTDVEPLKARQGGRREDPPFAAIKQDGLNYRFIEFCCNPGRDILRPEYLPDTGPGASGFPHLIADCLEVVIVLGQQAP